MSKVVDFKFWQRVASPVRRAVDRARSVETRRRIEREAQAWFGDGYPIIDPKTTPPGEWLPDDSEGDGRKWVGQYSSWRTWIGPALVSWHRGEPSDKAWNVLMPDGSRDDLRESALGWRRPARPPKLWIYGQLALRDDDVEFIDAADQPRYSPPPRGGIPNLEAELARLPEFVRDLQDDAFAATALDEFTYQEWIRIDRDKFEKFRNLDSLRTMIAGLRAKGETSFDVGITDSRPWPRVSSQIPDCVHRLENQMAQLGWRKINREDREAAFRENFRKRLKLRVDALRKIESFERRRARQCKKWMTRRPRYTRYPAPILESDYVWLGELTPEEWVAYSGELTRRLVDLAMSGRITREDFDKIKYAIGLTAIDLLES